MVAQRLRDEACVLRVAALTLVEQARMLAQQVDQLVALEVDHGYATAPSRGLQEDLLRLLPPALPSRAARVPAPQPPPVPRQTPEGVAAAMGQHPAFADDFIWAFLEHARTSFEPPRPKTFRAPFAAAPPIIDLRDHVHHAALALRRLLPPSGQAQVDTIMMHFDHEVLRVTYRNAHTLVMAEPLKDIPRAYFLATADGFAWDLRELVQAIAANGGTFKNPINHTWFAQSDIKTILAHPTGAELRRAQAAQSLLRDGVRQETAAALRKLGTAWMTDQANDAATAIASAHATAEFRAFFATLPEQEQRDIAQLRTTGVDRHSGAVYAASTVQAVLDDTETCFHKRGDMLEQTAAALLQRMAGR